MAKAGIAGCNFQNNSSAIWGKRLEIYSKRTLHRLVNVKMLNHRKSSRKTELNTNLKARGNGNFPRFEAM